MKEKYKYIKNILSQDFVNYLSFYTQHTKDRRVKDTPGNDGDTKKTIAIHSADSSVYKNLLHFLHPKIEGESNLNLQPIYGYSRIYLPGSELRVHKDRPACEISVTLTLKYSYTNPNYKWPLCMEDIPVVIESGDGVLYKGCEIKHWRPIFIQPKPSWHHQVFLHYVDKNGPYKNLKEEHSVHKLNYYE